MLRAAKQFGPSLYGFAASLYGNGKQDLAYFLDGADVETIECETGVTQGCGLGTLLFALAFHECITSRSWKKYYFKLSTLRVQSFAWWASTGGHSLEITRCVVVVVVLFHIQNKP